ncbi:MAG: putative porin, partial [Bacteroidota bacterium]
PDSNAPSIPEERRLIRNDSLKDAEQGEQRIRLQHTNQPALWTWQKDSVRLLDYHYSGEIAEAHPAITLLNLGNFGQPAWLSMAGSSSLQSTVTVNGLNVDNLTGSTPDPYRYSTEDAVSFTIYPQYQAFWYGAPGDLLVMNMKENYWDADRPITRLHHTEAADDYLFTDAMFTLNTSEGSNLFIGLTRTSIGVSSNNNAARFANNRHESWNIRLRYRWQFSEAISLHTRFQYDDHLTLLNGGVRGSFSPMAPNPYLFEDEDSGTFAVTAFDPVAAEFVNQTMRSEGQHYFADIATRVQWSLDSSQVTEFRVTADSDVRRFRDNMLLLFPDYDIAAPRLNLTDHWSLFQAVLDHQTNLNWAQLELQGLVGRYGASMGGEALDDADVIAHARGKLSLLFGPVSLSGFGRLDYRFGSSTLSFGAGGDLPIGPLSVWGGASFSARPQSLIERMYSGARVTVSGDRTPNLDKVAILEGGLRFDSNFFAFDLRGFARNETRYLELLAAAYTDSLLGRYRLEVRELPGGVQRGSFGASIDARLKLWRIHIDQQASLLTTDGDVTDRFAPRFSYSAEVYYDGMLIEGTLHLRGGARFVYTDQFTPLIYHPETGLFLRQVVDDPALRSYTDMQRIDLFLFATIKERATLHLVFFNVLNANSITTAFYPMFDRTFRLGVDWVFFD